MKLWTHWHKPQQRLMPPALASWLTDTGSLTRRLQKCSQYHFSVQLLGQHWIKPLPEECLAMRRPLAENAMQREVMLLDGSDANVYARTVIPLQTYQAMKYRFNQLGNRSLGELLFTDPFIARDPIEIACLRTGERLYEMAVVGKNERPKELWARRSCFYLGGKILLVNEIFLPNFAWG